MHTTASRCKIIIGDFVDDSDESEKHTATESCKAQALRVCCGGPRPGSTVHDY